MTEQEREARDRARDEYFARHVDNECDLPGCWRNIENALMFGFDAALAAERERIVDRCTVNLKDESLMDAYDEGFNDGLTKAIEIVKGGKNNGDHCG